MVSRNFLYIIVALLLLPIISSTALCKDFPICGGFMGIKDKELLPVMSDNGMNTALVAFWLVHSPMSKEEQVWMADWSQQCNACALDFWPVVSLWGNGEKSWAKINYKFKNSDRDFKNTPCPLSTSNYKVLVNDRIIEMARLAKNLNIKGFVLDTEMYAGDVLQYNNLCFCDDCQNQFRANYKKKKIAYQKNWEKYVTSSGLTNDYRAIAIERLRKMAAATRSTITSILPQFKIGATHLDKLNPYAEGLSRGFAAADNPVYIFSERPYTDGYSEYIPQTIEKFESMGINSRFISGIWQDKFPVENLAEQYYYCAAASDGYWIYTMQTLNPTWPYPLPEARDPYWAAIKKADIELQALAADTSYKSDLKLREIRFPVENIDYNSISIDPVVQIAAIRSQPEDINSLYFHSVNKLIFFAKKDDKIHFQVKFTQRPDTRVKYAEIVLITKTGKILARDEANSSKDALLDAVAPANGSYCIVLNPEHNMLNVSKFSHLFSIDCSKEAHFIRPKNKLYLWQKPNIKQGKISFLVDGVGESITTTFTSEEGTILGKYDILSKQSIIIPLTASVKGQIVTMEAKPRAGAYFEDVLVNVDSGFEKYISPFKAGMVKYISSD